MARNVEAPQVIFDEQEDVGFGNKIQIAGEELYLIGVYVSGTDFACKVKAAISGEREISSVDFQSAADVATNRFDYSALQLTRDGELYPCSPTEGFDITAEGTYYFYLNVDIAMQFTLEVSDLTDTGTDFSMDADITMTSNE